MAGGRTARSRSRGARSPCDLRSARETRPLRRGQLAEVIIRPINGKRGQSRARHILSYQAPSTAIFKGVIAEVKAVGSGVGWGTPAEERVGGPWLSDSALIAEGIEGVEKDI